MCLLHLLGIYIVRLSIGFDIKFVWLQPLWKREGWFVFRF